MKKMICLLLTVAMAISPFSAYTSYAQGVAYLPPAGQILPTSRVSAYTVLRGVHINPNNPLRIDFVLDNPKGKKLSKNEFNRLVSYFMAALTIPQEDFWVNLSPFEKDRVIPEALAKTDFGRDLLAQDYVLKQLSASLTYPESNSGSSYWRDIEAATVKSGLNRTQVANACSKVWIVPDNIDILTRGNFAFVNTVRLKVLTEEDYMATQGVKNASAKNDIALEAFKKHIIPVLTREVNRGVHFTRLRQMFYSFALALWFKNKVKDSFFQYYIDQNKVAGIDLKDKTIKDKIYKQYTEAFVKGVYSMTKSERTVNKISKRSYFSGGVQIASGGEPGTLPDGYHITNAALKAVLPFAGLLYLASGGISCGGMSDARPKRDASGEAGMVYDGGNTLVVDGKNLDTTDAFRRLLEDGAPVWLGDGPRPDFVTTYKDAGVDGKTSDAGVVADAAGDPKTGDAPFYDVKAIADTADTAGTKTPDTATGKTDAPKLADTASTADGDVKGADLPGEEAGADAGKDLMPDLTADATPDNAPDATPDTVKEKDTGTNPDTSDYPFTIPVDTVNKMILATYKYSGIPASYWQSASLDDVLTAQEQAFALKFKQIAQLVADIVNEPSLSGVDAHAVAGLFLRRGNGGLAAAYWGNPEDTTAKAAYFDSLAAVKAEIAAVRAAAKTALAKLTSDYKDYYVRVIERIIDYNGNTLEAFKKDNPDIFTATNDAEIGKPFALAMIKAAAKVSSADAQTLYDKAGKLLEDVSIFTPEEVNDPWNRAATAIASLGVSENDLPFVPVNILDEGANFINALRSSGAGISQADFPGAYYVLPGAFTSGMALDLDRRMVGASDPRTIGVGFLSRVALSEKRDMQAMAQALAAQAPTWNGEVKTTKGVSIDYVDAKGEKHQIFQSKSFILMADFKGPIANERAARIERNGNLIVVLNSNHTWTEQEIREAIEHEVIEAYLTQLLKAESSDPFFVARNAHIGTIALQVWQKGSGLTLAQRADAAEIKARGEAEAFSKESREYHKQLVRRLFNSGIARAYAQNELAFQDEYGGVDLTKVQVRERSFGAPIKIEADAKTIAAFKNAKTISFELFTDYQVSQTR